MWLGFLGKEGEACWLKMREEGALHLIHYLLTSPSSLYNDAAWNGRHTPKRTLIEEISKNQKDAKLQHRAN